MYRTYLLSFDSDNVTRESVVSLIDSMSEVVNWQVILPSTIAVVTQKSVQELSSEINEQRSSKFRFILVEPKSKNGWLTRASWEFINNPKPVD